jgi:nucleoside 2-deoxyribosyltransferase
MTDTKTVYLCGGINKLSDAECKDWREEAKCLLGPEFETLDPMRRDYRGREGDFSAEIVRHDQTDIAMSDIILVRAEKPSWGTAMEMVYAKLLGKFVVVFGAGDKPSPWIVFHSNKMFPNLNEAISWINAYLAHAKKFAV